MIKKYILGISGGSGGLYSISVLRGIIGAGHKCYLVTSKPGRRILSLETDTKLSGSADKDKKILVDKYGLDENLLEVIDEDDVGASIASGSFRTSGMAIVPCSTGSLGSLANGISRGLIERAADVCLKERRKLIIVPRETPYSLIHLENMTKLTRAGAIILPASPGFYNLPKKIEDLVDMISSRVLEKLDIEPENLKEWKGE
ncbi:MAG: UbiX family flavin prenyltransferase [Chloroflexota bacterium]|nr:UbiX family flavin prenyltransferase [Chloroflexota bacterium]